MAAKRRAAATKGQLQEAARAGLRVLLEAVPDAEGGAVYLLNDARGVLECVAAARCKATELPPVPRELVRERLPADRATVLPHPTGSQALLGRELGEALAAGRAVASLLLLPVRAGEDAIACVCVGSRREPGAFSPRDLTRLAELGRGIGLALAGLGGELACPGAVLRFLYERMAHAVFVLSPEGEVRDANPAAEELTGRPRDELLGRRVDTDLTEKPPEWFVDARDRALRGESVALDLTVRCRDGPSRSTQCTLVGMEVQGEPVLLLLCRGLTEAERRVRELEGRLAALESLANLAPALSRARDRREAVQEVVSAARAITGAEHANLLVFSPDGRHVETLDPIGAPKIPVQVRPRGFSAWILRTGEPLLLDEIHPDGRTTPEVRDERGERIPASEVLAREGIRSLAGLPVVVGGAVRAILYVHSRKPGALAGTLPVLRLLAAQAGAALESALLLEELRESEAWWRELFDQSPVSLWIEDFSAVKARLDALREAGVTDLRAHLADHPELVRESLGLLRVVDVNAATLRLFGATAKEQLFAQLPRLIGAAVLPLWREELVTIWEARREFQGEGTNQTLDGRTLHIRLGWRVLPGSEEDYGRVLVSLLDVTDAVAAQRALERSGQVLRAVAYAAQQFLRTPSWDEAIPAVLARLGQAVAASRAYVFREHTDGEGRVVVSQEHEWVAPGFTPQIDNPKLQDFPYVEAGYRRWAEAFARGEAIHGPVRELPEEERPLLEAQDILSIVVVPILAYGRRWGFIGFDDCVEERIWTETEVEALRTAAEAFGQAVELLEVEEELDRRRREAEALFQISVAVGQGLDLERMFGSLYQELVAVGLPCDAFVAALVEREQGQIRLAFGVENGARVPELVLPLDPAASLSGWVASTRQPLLVRDAEAEADRLPATPVRVGKEVRSWLGVPLVVGEEVVGVVSIQSFLPDAYDEEDLRFMVALGAPVAAAIANARTYLTVAELERKLRAVEDASREMKLAPDRATLYGIVLDLARSVLGYKECAVLERVGEELVVVTGHETVAWAQGLRVGLGGRGITVAAAQSGEDLYIPDVRADPRYVPGNPRTRSELALPLTAGGQLFGVLDVQVDRVDGIPPQDRGLLRIVASELAVALAGLEKLARLEELGRKLAGLHEVARALARCSSEEEVAQAVVRALVEVLGFEHANVGLGRGDVLVPVAGAGTISGGARPFRRGEGVAGKVWQSGETLWGNLDAHPEARPVSLEIRSFICVPIGALGVIQVISTRRDAFTADDVSLVEVLARHAFEEMRRVQFERELREQATRDPLTGLYNRRFLGEALAREIERAKRYGHPLTLVMVDVDDFKAVNDRYGHVVGDTALRRVAEALLGNVRAGDLVFRYGGEEFVVLLPETENGGGPVARLQEVLAAIPVPEAPGLVVSVSLGYVTWNPLRDGPVTLEDLLQQADKVLYEIKRRRGGR